MIIGVIIQLIISYFTNESVGFDRLFNFFLLHQNIELYIFYRPAFIRKSSCTSNRKQKSLSDALSCIGMFTNSKALLAYIKFIFTPNQRTKKNFAKSTSGPLYMPTIFYLWFYKALQHFWFGFVLHFFELELGGLN